MSVLRNMWELDIARVFCRHTKYLPVFLSCNEPKVSSNCACLVLLSAAVLKMSN